MRRSHENGISLLNVLAVVAAGAGLVQVMLTDQETAIDRLGRAAETSQATALAQAGVTSVAVALRRDLRDAPDTDHMNEPWASALQQAISLDFGQFEVTAEDMRGRFDLNAIGPAQFAELRVFSALLNALDLPVALSAEIAATVAQRGPLNAPSDLLQLGMSAADFERLQPHVTALPTRHPINLNSASLPVLTALLANPVAAEVLNTRRQAKGFLEPGDLTSLGQAMPPMAGFASDAFRIEATGTVGAARSRLARLLLRDAETGQVSVHWTE